MGPQWGRRFLSKGVFHALVDEQLFKFLGMVLIDVSEWKCHIEGMFLVDQKVLIRVVVSVELIEGNILVCCSVELGGYLGHVVIFPRRRILHEVKRPLV